MCWEYLTLGPFKMERKGLRGGGGQLPSENLKGYHTQDRTGLFPIAQVDDP